MEDNLSRRPVVVTVIMASSLMLSFGLAHRIVAARLAAPVTTTPIARQALKRFPMQIAGWTGQDVPLDEAIVSNTGTDAHVSRRYSRRNGLESVSLYVACGVDLREVMLHRPQRCYPGAGWMLVGRGRTDGAGRRRRTRACRGVALRNDGQ